VPLTLVLGPANSAKAGEVLGAFEAAARRGAVLVVPTALDARHYTREFAGSGAVLGSVLTFDGLAGEIGRRAGYAGRRLSDLQRERVLERALERSRPVSAGFLAAAGELIAELQRGLISVPRFAGALQRWAAEDSRRDQYARELAGMYGAYSRELDRAARVDREMFAWRSLDALRAAPGRWGGEAVFFYGFDELTALERDAVETLSRLAGAEVTVSLTYEPGREALRSRAEAVEELRPLATRVLELPARDDHYVPEARAVLHHLERSLFEPAPERVEPGAAVVLLEAGGERAEAELVAARVLELLRSGVRGEEIVIVHRSLRRAASLLERVLGQYGISVAGGREVSFGHTPLGRALLGGARCALLDDEAAPGDLLDYLRAPGLIAQREIVDGLEAEVRIGAMTTAGQARRALGWALPELEAVRAAPEPLAELCILARRLFAAPHAAAAPILTRAEELDARALATLDRARAELAEVGGELSGPRLIELLGELPVRVPAAEGPREVLLAEPLQIRARRFRVVFVCGLQEGEFPAPARPEPFLPDERRWELAASSGLRLRPHEDGLARERYLFYAAISRATEQVVLSYRSSDEEGNLALPSPFLADVAELLDEAWPARRERRLLADVVWPAERAPTTAELERSLAAAGAPTAGEEPQRERLLGELALGHVRHSRILSAGALETYADCPMRWLVERELRPQPLEPEPEPIVRGNLMHDVLERLLRRLGGPVDANSLPRAQTLLSELLAERAPAGGSRLAPGRPDVVRAGALRAIEADLRRYLEHEARTGGGGWRPEGLELRFGFDVRADDGESGPAGSAADSLPPLELEAGGQRLLLRGMIDRVDVDSAGRAMVRDYKSGASRPEHPGARWSADRRLQVALYMLVVRQLLHRDPAAGFYQPLRGDDLRARGIFRKGVEVGGVVPTDGREAEELDSELDDAAARAVALAAALRSGGLTPCPQNCSRDGCAYPGICRSQ
jgi:RecB family exonuclease